MIPTSLTSLLSVCILSSPVPAPSVGRSILFIFSFRVLGKNKKRSFARIHLKLCKRNCIVSHSSFFSLGARILRSIV